MSEASNLINSIKRQTQPFLTGDMTQSVDYVYHNLSEQHAKAALWLFEKKSMTIDSYNLHDLILNYDNYKALAKGQIKVIDLLGIKKGKFNPHHLLKYFLSLG